MPTPPPNTELARRMAERFLGVLPDSLQEQSGGLSGARVWRVESPRGCFALRQYPTEFPTEARLGWLHRILNEVRDRGCALLPCPVASSTGATWIKHEEQLWELLTWVHGEPMLETNPSRELLIQAATTLAELHRVTSQIGIDPIPGINANTPHTGLVERLELLNQWFSGDKAQLAQRLAQRQFDPLLADLFQLQGEVLQQHGPRLRSQLEQVSRLATPRFPVLRDVQPAHVIFNGESVAGFIDVTATRIDSPMSDLARMLSRWRFSEPTWYADAVAAYRNVRPITNDERNLLNAYDDSARLLTGAQWLRWIVLEKRKFSNHDLVEQHWQRIMRDLERILKSSTLFAVPVT